ncbi:hypothetical protein HMPREF3036_02624 [Sutterella sp. KLE1602]|nr:hypothetical protein HMPREF3036_02624 [Sutterella sp. KLE1602]
MERLYWAVLLFQVHEGFPTIAASKKSAMANLSVDAHSRTHCFVLPHLTSYQSFIRLKLHPTPHLRPEFQLVETFIQRPTFSRSFIRLKLASNVMQYEP